MDSFFHTSNWEKMYQKASNLFEPKEDLLISLYVRHSLVLHTPIENIQIFQYQNKIYCQEPYWDAGKDIEKLRNLPHLEPTIDEKRRPIDQEAFEHLLEKIYLLPDVNLPELPMMLDGGFCRLTINLPNFKRKYIWADTYYDCGYLPKNCTFVYGIRQEIYKTVYPNYTPPPQKIRMTQWEYIKYRIFNYLFINKLINYFKESTNK